MSPNFNLLTKLPLPFRVSLFRFDPWYVVRPRELNFDLLTKLPLTSPITLTISCAISQMSSYKFDVVPARVSCAVLSGCYLPSFNCLAYPKCLEQSTALSCRPVSTREKSWVRFRLKPSIHSQPHFQLGYLSFSLL